MKEFYIRKIIFEDVPLKLNVKKARNCFASLKPDY